MGLTSSNYNNDLVSIAIPTHNRADLLTSCLKSAMKQSYKNIEILICDNASTDDTIAVIRRYLYDKRIRIFHNRVNIGMVANWNRCLTVARGRFFLLLSDDDILQMDCVEKLIEGFLRDENVVQVIGRCFYIDELGNRLGKTPIYPSMVSPDKLLRKSFSLRKPLIVYPCATLHTTHSLREIGGYQEVGNHADLYARIAVALKSSKRTYFLPNLVSKYRVHPNSASIKSSEKEERTIPNVICELKTLQARLDYVALQKEIWGSKNARVSCRYIYWKAVQLMMEANMPVSMTFRHIRLTFFPLMAVTVLNLLPCQTIRRVIRFLWQKRRRSIPTVG